MVCTKRMAQMSIVYWRVACATVKFPGMGEHIAQLVSDRRGASQKRLGEQTAAAMGRKLLGVIVYQMGCRMDGRLSVDDLSGTEIGDWKMPDFRAACTFAACQGWLIVNDGTLTLTRAGFAAA